MFHRILIDFQRATHNIRLVQNCRTWLNPTKETKFSPISRLYSSGQASKMRFIRFQKASDNKVRVGAISDNGKQYLPLPNSLPNDMIELIKHVESSESGSALKSGEWQPLTSDIKLLAPIDNPEKIICIGLNYLGHCQEQKKEPPKEPMFFSKFASTITGPTGEVILHKITEVCWSLAVIHSYKMFVFSNWTGKSN